MLRIAVAAQRRTALKMTLNRPDRLNAIDTQVHADLQALCRDLREDYETRVVIFTGAGAFSAGADIGSSRTPRGRAATSTMLAQQGSANVLQERIAAGIGSRTPELLEGLTR